MTVVRPLALLLAVLCCSVQAQNGRWQRPRRQFPGGEWVPLTQPCPTCRPLNDPNDGRLRFEDIGLVPPRPPVTRQIHGSANFFSQNAGLLNGGFSQRQPFQSFLSFNQPSSIVQFPQSQQQPFFTQQQQQSFLPQTYLNNPQLLLKENPQLLPLVNNPQLLLSQPQQQQQQQQQQIQQSPITTAAPNKDNQIRFRPEASTVQDLKPPQNVRLEQEKTPTAAPVTRLELPLHSPPSPFNFPGAFQQQQNFQRFPQIPEQQSLLQVNPSDPFISQGPFRNFSSDITIPGLEKEEIQLLYVPVETLRQRGQLQGHTIDDDLKQFNQQPFQQFQQLQQNPVGHFITQPPNQPTPSPVTPPPELTLPLRETPQPFATELPPPAPTTTEKIVTIQPRPVSTVRQQERLTTRPSTRFTEPPKTTLPVLGANTFKEPEIDVTEPFENEVTPSFVQNRQTTAPPTVSESFQKLQDFPVRHRFTARPPVETVTEATVPTTTLQPHQPPLSIYVASNLRNPQIVDALRILKNAQTIPVIDTFSNNLPTVFVGPANLNSPSGFGKFELPYLSNLDSRRLESRDNLPFFVAPLNFNPPEGYVKIPFPPPHVGSVVVSVETETQSTVHFATTPQPFPTEQVNSIEPEPTTVLPETTTTARTRGRRPNQYRTRKPVSQRQRVTQRPLEEEINPSTQENVVTQDFLRDPQEERKRPSAPRRQRLRTTTTTTEALEPVVTEAPQPVVQPEVPFEAQGSVVELKPQFLDFDQPQPPAPQLQQPVHPHADFHRQRPVQPLNNFRQEQPNDFQRQRPSQSLPLNEFRQEGPADFRRHPEQPLNDFRQEQPIHPPVDFRTPDLDFRPPPPPPAFNQFGATLQPPQPAFQQPGFVQQPPLFQPQFPPSQPEAPGIFEVPPPPSPSQPEDLPNAPYIENNGNSGFQQPIEQNHQEISTAQPSTTQFSESPTSSAYSEVETEQTAKSTTTTVTQAPEINPDAETIDKELENVEIPKKTSKFSYPNVPGVKSHPNPTKVRSHVRSRPRGSHSYKSTTTTAPAADEEPAHVEVSATAEESSTTTTESTRSKYQSHFNRSRKPLRTTTPRTETTTASSTVRSHTVRPLRRTTVRTSVSTKRIRKPTTPTPYDEEEEKKVFGPSAASNEVFDDIPKPKSRKPYFHKHRTTTEVDETASSAPSAPSGDEEPKIEESRVSESAHEVTTETVSGPSASGPSAPEEEPKKHSEDRKKPDYTKKGRKRLRVRVQKRPHDNFETAESQNHGSLANALSSNTKPTVPDLYKFNQGEFDFSSSGKFIGTQQKGVRNITADILENTSTFSSPGTDAEVHKVTIANEPITETPEVSRSDLYVTEKMEPVVEDKTEITDISRNETVEVTTQRHETTVDLGTTETQSVETTTIIDDDFLTTVTVEPTTTTTTTPTTTTTEDVPEVRQKKVLKTSTTTQVSHETEICYKGKCIKTSADNPDDALKQLVESVNSDDSDAKVKT